MQKMIGVSFKKNGRVEYFDAGNFQINKNITVITETEKGIQFGKVVTPIIETKSKKKLNKIIRIATKEDYEKHKQNIKDAKEALINCRKIIKKQNLNMNVLDAMYTFDRDQLIFRFISDSRVDFRDLAKELASHYHTRIELRQVGVRDKAQEVGGVGSCGRALCCAKFLKNFDSVSINMAKNQNLSLNPNKINGVCGRLLCCLKYENNEYKNCRKCLPDIGDTVKIKEGKGKVVNLDILKKVYMVELEDGSIVEVKNEGCPSNS